MSAARVSASESALYTVSITQNSGINPGNAGLNPANHKAVLKISKPNVCLQLPFCRKIRVQQRVGRLLRLPSHFENSSRSQKSVRRNRFGYPSVDTYGFGSTKPRQGLCPVPLDLASIASRRSRPKSPWPLRAWSTPPWHLARSPRAHARAREHARGWCECLCRVTVGGD